MYLVPPDVMWNIVNISRLVAAIGHCQVLIYIVGGFLVVGNCSTVLLFLLQVRAVYDGSKIITGFFGILWAALLGLTIMVPLSLEAFVSSLTTMHLWKYFPSANILDLTLTFVMCLVHWTNETMLQYSSAAVGFCGHNIQRHIWHSRFLCHFLSHFFYYSDRWYLAHAVQILFHC